MRGTDIANLHNLRKRMFLTSYAHGTTHLASAFSCTEILYALYVKGVLDLGDIGGQDKTACDHFILSKGHAAIALYAVLESIGILDENELDTFLMPGTRLAGEPCRRDLPVIEASTGSLGHGLSVGLGMALSQKLIAKENNIVPARTFVLLGDGECQEGSVWEAAMSAASYGADNLTAILDCNGLQKMNEVKETMRHVAWEEKWKAFGWQVETVDGHDVDAITDILNQPNESKKPRIIIANTVKGKGVSIMENSAQWHYKPFKNKDIKAIAEELNITDEELQKCKELS